MTRQTQKMHLKLLNLDCGPSQDIGVTTFIIYLYNLAVASGFEVKIYLLSLTSLVYRGF